MKSLCVFCGSNMGANDVYSTEAEKLGKYLASCGIEIIYGGSNLGLMGILANAALAAGGKVTAIMPSFLRDLAGHENEAKLIVTETMHERKLKMYDLSDGFIAFPGGFGTLEEIFEVITWTQLGIHAKPCGFLNINNYFDKLFDFLDYVTKQKFINQINRDMILVDSEIEGLLGKFKKFNPPKLINGNL